MTPLHCLICQAPLTLSATGTVQCPNGHFIMTMGNFTYTTAFGTSTSTTGHIYLSKPEPARTPVPDAFYRAFEEEQPEQKSSIAFECESCGTSLTITAHSPRSVMSGTFCPKCNEQYYVRWAEGELKRGRMGE